MKKFIISFVFLISCTYVFGQLGYRVGSKFIELSSDNSSLYFVQTKNADQMKRLQKDTINGQSNNVKVIANLSDNACIVNSKSFGEGHYVSEIYKNREGYKIIILPRIAIKMKNGYEIENILKKFSKAVTLDKKKVNLYLVDCQAEDAEDVLKINNEINKQESVEWCEPMMIGEARKLNQLEGLQYYLKNVDQYGNPAGVDINVEPAWDLVVVDTTLVVAVIDDGVERNQEDLIGSVVDGYTIGDSNGKGEPINEFANYNYNNFLYSDTKSHGTACAGIIGARNNSIGIRGVASGVRILPINVHPQSCPIEALPYPSSWYEGVGDAITWAYTTGNADVINCSMSFEENTYISNALNNAMNYGRNGKGTIVVCASGSNPYYGVNFPANMSNTIAVGSIDNTGIYCYYSGRGTALDLVAPSVNTYGSGNVVTTDRSAPKGYNISEDYVYDFGGSSASCPQVAGVVALMLSYYPNLTVSNVRGILRNTACKLPGMNGLNRTNDYGYGLVDAYAAIIATMELSLSISGPSYICGSSTGTYSISNLPSSYTVNWVVDDSDFNITTSGNQCSVTYTGTGQYDSVNLSANIYYNNNFIKQFTQSITYGTPLITGELRITGGDGSHLHWTSNIGGNTVDIEEVCNIPLNYSQFEGDLYRLSPITFEPEATPIRHWNSFGVHEVVDYLTPGWYLLMVRGINNCGVSADLGAEIECVDTDMLRANGNGTELALMYNRLGQVLTVSVNHADHSITNNAYTIQLWNETNMVRELRLTDSTVQIPMAGLKNGLYTIRYVNNDEVIAKKFMK